MKLDDVKLLLWISLGFVIVAVVVFFSHREHETSVAPTVAEVVISAEPLPRPSEAQAKRFTSTRPRQFIGRDAGD